MKSLIGGSQSAAEAADQARRAIGPKMSLSPGHACVLIFDPPKSESKSEINAGALDKDEK